MIVSNHAIERYIERIRGDAEEALQVLDGAAVHVAAEFGARVVRIPRGRVLLNFADGGAVVTTVVPISHLPRQLIPHAWGGPPPSRLELLHLQKEAI